MDAESTYMHKAFLLSGIKFQDIHASACTWFVHCIGH
jgi:hypothetical protein